MNGMIVVYLIFLVALPIIATRSPINLPFLQSLNNYIAGFFAGAVGLLITTGILHNVFSPQLMEFDILIYPLFTAPIGGLLGGLTGLVVYISRQGARRNMRRLLFFATVPIVALSIYIVYDFLSEVEQFSRTKSELAFWLLAYGLPIIWVLVLWLSNLNKRTLLVMSE